MKPGLSPGRLAPRVSCAPRTVSMATSSTVVTTVLPFTTLRGRVTSTRQVSLKVLIPRSCVFAPLSSFSCRHQSSKAKSPPNGVARDATLLQTIRTILRQNGSLPLSRLTSFLTDEMLEELAEYDGGLAGFCRAHTNWICLQNLPAGVLVAVPCDCLRQVNEADARLVTYCIALLTAGAYLPRSAGVPPIPTLEQLIAAVPPSLMPPSLRTPLRLERALAAYPTLFLLEGDRAPGNARRVRLHGVRYADVPPASSPSSSPSSAPAAFPSAGRVRLGTARSVSSSWSRSESACAAPTDGRGLRLRAVVEETLPSAFFVPLTAFLRQPAVQAVWPVATTSVEEVKKGLRSLPDGLIDVRAFGEAIEDVYLRLMEVQQVVLVPRVECLDAQGNADLRRYDIGPLAQRVLHAFRTYASAERTQHLQLIKGLPMERLNEVLPADLLHELDELLSAPSSPLQQSDASVADGLIPPSSPRVFVLVFDRLRHLFDVHLGRAEVRLWSVLPPEDQPSSLTWNTTPLPWVLRGMVDSLRDGPLSVHELLAALPSHLQDELLARYAATPQGTPDDTEKEGQDTTGEVRECSEPFGGAVNDNMASPGPTPSIEAVGIQPVPNQMTSSETVSERACREFIAHHSLFLCVPPLHSGTELVYTPQLLASQQRGSRRRGGASDSGGEGCVRPPARRHYTDTDRAEIIYQLLPDNQAVDWWGFVGNPEVAQRLPFEVPKRAEFFTRFPAYFRVYEPFASNRFVVARADIAPPPAGLLQPRLNTVEALIKFMALHAVGGVVDSSIMNNTSKEGRALMKRFNSRYADLAEQLPMWFEVKRDHQNSAGSIITYIGPLPGGRDGDSQNALPALPTVVNDPSAVEDAVPPAEAAEGGDGEWNQWHDDWNETPSE